MKKLGILAFISLALCLVVGIVFSMPLIENIDIASLPTWLTGGGIGGGLTVASSPIWFTMKGNNETFKTLSEGEVDKLTDEDKSKYLADLIKWQTKSINDIQLAREKEGADRKALETQLNDLRSANITAMKTQIESMSVGMAKLMKEVEVKTADKPLEFKTAIYNALEEKKDDISKFMEAKSGTIQLEVKASHAASDIDSGTDFADMLPGVGKIATRKPFMRELFNQRNTTKEYIKYNDQETIVRDAKNVAGCAASTHNSKVTWKVRTLQITKVRDFTDVCIDMMDDYEWVSGEIKDLVSTDVRLKIDEGLLLGTAAHPELNSVKAVASTFAAGSYAAKVAKPTLIDLIKVNACQISDAGQNNKFNANYALINPASECLMTLEKDDQGRYLIPNWITSDGVNIGAVKIETNPLVPVNEMYVMDSTRGTVVSRKGVTVEMAFENNDNFEKELVTVKAYERLNLLVRNVDANAFLHVPDIAAAIVAITKP